MNFLPILAFFWLQLLTGSTQALQCHVCFPDKPEAYCRENSTTALCPPPTYDTCLFRVVEYRHNVTNRLERIWAQTCFPKNLCSQACQSNLLEKKSGYVISNCTASCCNETYCNAASPMQTTPMPINLQSTSTALPPTTNATATTKPSGTERCFSINTAVIVLVLFISIMGVKYGY